MDYTRPQINIELVMKKHNKLILAVSSIVVLSILMTVAGSMTGCYQIKPFIPDSIRLQAPTIETTVEDLLAEYLADQESADVKYNGKRIVFYEVLVEGAQWYFPHGQYHEDPMPDYITGIEDYWFVANSVVFSPKDPVYLYGVVAGSIVDVVGVCQGLSGDVIIVSDSWIKIAGGEVSGPAGY
ncbi:hypothetical protein ACFLYS_03300 [Chloroflexota bacterium]